MRQKFESLFRERKDARLTFVYKNLKLDVSFWLEFGGTQAYELTGSAVITHDVTTGTGYCLVGFDWIIDFFN